MLDKLSTKRKTWCLTMRILCYFSTLIVLALTAFILFFVLSRGLPKLINNPDILINTPSVRHNREGILPDIINTFYVIIATLFMVLPLGVGAAVYLTEYAKNKRIVTAIEFASETLSGIPSIIYGLVGMLLFVETLGFGTSLMAGCCTLVIMNLPTIMSTTEEALKTVPQSYREGAFALGSGKWHVIRTVVLPSCLNGILTGCVLTVGRILGESAALLYTAGLAHRLYGFLEGMANSGSTLTVALFIYAAEQGDFDIAYAIAVILILVTVAINLLTKSLEKMVEKRRGE